MKIHVRTTEDGDAPAVLPRRVDQDQNQESITSSSNLNDGITGPLSGSLQQILEPVAAEYGPLSGMGEDRASTPLDADEDVDTNNDIGEEIETTVCEDCNQQDESKNDEQSNVLSEEVRAEDGPERDEETVDATAVTEDDKEVEEAVIGEQESFDKSENGIPTSQQQDETPMDPITISDAVSNNAEEEMDLPMEEAMQRKEESVESPQDDVQELQCGGTVASPGEASQHEKKEAYAEKLHETVAGKEEESNETAKEIQTEEPVEGDEMNHPDPTGAMPGVEPSETECTVASGDKFSVQSEKEVNDDSDSDVYPKASDSSIVGQENSEHDPDSSQPNNIQTASIDPEEIASVIEEGADVVRESTPPKQADVSEATSATGTESSSKVSSLSSTSRKMRVPRKTGKGNRKGGDEENGFDAGSNEETIVEGRMRPAYNRKLHTLHKPNHYRNTGRVEEHEYTQATTGEDAVDEPNFIPLPGAFAAGSTPSPNQLVDEAGYSSDTDGSRLTKAETVTAAILAQEYDEEELEANRLENDHLRREVSQMRRERETVPVVVAVRPDEDGDDEQKGDNDEGSTTRKLQCLALFLLLIGGGVAAYFLVRTDEPEPATATPTPDLPSIMFVSESPSSPLSECQGDCDSDFDCKDGLECFQRDANDSVPGCLGGMQDESRTDYCVKKNYPAISKPDKFPLGICQGDCDEDSECDSGLICYQRSRGEAVPGCSGGEADQSETDFCIKVTTEEPEERQILGLCEGQCQDDTSCEPGLFCYQRDEMGEVPGCTDIVENASADRFCVSGVYEIGAGYDFPFSLCRGDCDDDTDCEDGLFCFQRSSGDGQAVPGCIGGLEEESNTDFCVRDIYREFTPFNRWGDQLVGIPGERFGASVGLSGDGQILVVGAMDDESSTGYVDVYKATESDTPGADPSLSSSSSPSSVIWTQLTRLEGETVGEAFGSKVALSLDGQTLVVGNAVNIPNTTRRAARIQVFQATATSGSEGVDLSNWTSVMVGSSNRTVLEMIGDEYDIDGFEFSVAISDDGKYVALGQPSNGGEKLDPVQRGPLIYRKERQEDGTDVMTYLGAPYARLFAGSSVAITTSSDGNPRVAAGGDNSVRGDGQVRVKELMVDYSNTDQVPMQLGDETEPLGWFEVATNSIGQSDNTVVDLSTDGNFVALAITNRTSLFYNNADGKETEIVSWNGPEHVIVYQFKKQGIDDYWDQIGNLISVPTSQVEHMPTVALSPDGVLLAVGEPWVNFNTGRVRVFKYVQSSNRWVPLQAPIVGRTTGELFGSTLSLTSSETESFTLAVGGPSQAGRGLVECYQLKASSLLESSIPENDAASNLQPKSRSRIQDLFWSP